MKCYHCSDVCIKKGKTKAGIQKYRCKGCARYLLENYKNKAWHPETNEKIIRCLKQSCGIRGTAFIIAISSVTVIRRIKLLAEKISKPILKLRREYEADELKTYIRKKKNEQWVIYAIDRKTRQVADFRIGRRTKRNIKPVIETLLLSEAKKIYTDKLNIYPSLIPRQQHKAVAHNINYIERKNLNLRTHIKRLSRKTLCFSKSIIMLTAIMKIYFWG